jgi:hypothetical protein
MRICTSYDKLESLAAPAADASLAPRHLTVFSPSFDFIHKKSFHLSDIAKTNIARLAQLFINFVSELLRTHRMLASISGEKSFPMEKITENNGKRARSCSGDVMRWKSPANSYNLSREKSHYGESRYLLDIEDQTVLVRKVHINLFSKILTRLINCS